MTKHFVNRGMLFGPWTPIYGFGAAIVVLLSDKLKKPWQLFVTVFVASGVLEYATAFVFEELYHAKWWDYSVMYFNLQGRICLEYLLLFATVACLVAYIVIPFIDKFYYKINTKVLTVILVIIITAICVDFVFSIFNPNLAATFL